MIRRVYRLVALLLLICGGGGMGTSRTRSKPYCDLHSAM